MEKARKASEGLAKMYTPDVEAMIEELDRAERPKRFADYAREFLGGAVSWAIGLAILAALGAVLWFTPDSWAKWNWTVALIIVGVALLLAGALALVRGKRDH